MPEIEIIDLLPKYLIHSKTYLFALTDIEGKILFVNQLFRQYFSSIADDFFGLTFTATLDTSDIDSFNTAITFCIKHPGDLSQITTRNPVNQQTEETELIWELSTLKNEGNEIIGITCIGHTSTTVKKKNNEELNNEFYRFSLIAKNTSNAILITDKNRNITWVNDGFTRISGYSFEEVIGKNPIELLDFDVIDEQTIQTVREKLNQTQPAFFELRNKGKHGKIYWLEIEVQPLKDEQGEHIGFMAIQSDITHRKKVEELMLMSEVQLMANLDNTPNVAVQWYDEEGRVIYWNPASERLYHWKSEEAIGKTLDQLIHTPEEMAEFLRILSEIKRTGQPYGPYEAGVAQKDGTQKWVLATTFIIPMGKDRIGFVCMDVDITEQKKIANELIESEEKYRSVVSAVGEGLLVQDINDKIIMCNQSASDILELPLDQLIGKYSLDLNLQAIKEDKTPYLFEEQPARMTLKTGKPVFDVLMNVQVGNGRRKFIVINSRPVLNHKGEMYAAVASFRDISAQKNAEQKLKKINKDLVLSQEQLKQNLKELYTSQAKIEEQKQHLEQEINERKQIEMKILAQNEILREIAWHQSHSLRRPVATILGLIHLINREKDATENEKEQYLAFLLRTAEELDAVIHTIVEKTNEIE